MIWYDTIRYDTIWYDMIWYDMIYMIWYDMIWYDMIWYDMIWYDMIWYDMIWYDMIWYVMLWYGMKWYDMMIYLLTAIGLTPGGSSTVHIYTQTIHRTTQSTKTMHRIQLTNWKEWGAWPVFTSYTLAFALQLRKKHGKLSVRVAEECQLARWKQSIHNRVMIRIGSCPIAYRLCLFYVRYATRQSYTSYMFRPLMVHHQGKH